MRLPPGSTLFPYTTLFRSGVMGVAVRRGDGAEVGRQRVRRSRRGGKDRGLILSQPIGSCCGRGAEREGSRDRPDLQGIDHPAVGVVWAAEVQLQLAAANRD